MHGLTQSYILDMFQEKTFNHNLRSKLITQPKFLSQAQGYHSLRQDGICLWDKLPNIHKDAEDVNSLKQMIVKFVNCLYSVFNIVLKLYSIIALFHYMDDGIKVPSGLMFLVICNLTIQNISYCECQ